MISVPQPRRDTQPTSTSWHEQAVCQEDPELFFHPEGETGGLKERRIAEAIALCDRCPVKRICRADALERREEYGIRGGLSEDDRAAILAGNPANTPAHLHLVPYQIPATKRNRTLDPAPVVAHIGSLVDAGFNPTSIGRFAGVSPDTVRAIFKGLKKEIFPATAQLLLSVQVRKEVAA